MKLITVCVALVLGMSIVSCRRPAPYAQYGGTGMTSCNVAAAGGCEPCSVSCPAGKVATCLPGKSTGTQCQAPAACSCQ